jgi:hypothetical protein
MVNQQEALRGRPAGLRLIDITKVIGQGLAVLGVTAAFWHVTPIAGVAIVVSGLIAVVIHATAYTRIEGLDTPPDAA